MKLGMFSMPSYGFAGESREMTAESVEMIMKLWSEEPGWKQEGKFWTASVPTGIPELTLHQHLKPLQQPHPPIGVAGLSSPSPTLELAGERGWIPMSLNLNPGYVKSHWDSYRSGRGGAATPCTGASGAWCGRCSSPRPTRRPTR